MTTSDVPSRKPLTPDDLIALNEEIASLVRAGVPLEMGLAGLGLSVSGRLGRLSERLAEHMNAGAFLPEALAAEGSRLPGAYRAVVEAGLESGRLPEALESLTRYARSMAEVRRRLALALIYPCVVLGVAYVLFIAFILSLVPQLAAMYESSRLPVRNWLPAFESLHRTVIYWGPAVPIVMVLLLVAFGPWRGPQRLFPGRFGWVPGLHHYHRAMFTNLLAILLEHEVRLAEALRLAAEATEDRAFIGETAKLADNVQSGRSLRESLPAATRFPPFMKWMMTTGEQQGALVPALRQLSEVYRRRASRQARLVQLVLPVVLTLGLGGSVVFAYALSLFIPLSDLLKDLSM